MALTEIALGNFKESAEYLQNAINFSDKMKNPRDLGTVYFAEYTILKIMENIPELKEVYKEHFKNNIDYYKDKALEYLDVHRDAYEITTLNNSESMAK